MANEAKLQDVKRKVDSMIGLRGGDQYDLQSTVAWRTDPANNGKVEGGL